jgi:hypothetical protein
MISGFDIDGVDLSSQGKLTAVLGIYFQEDSVSLSNDGENPGWNLNNVVTSNGITQRDAYTIEASERVNSTSVFKRGIRRDIARMIDEIGPENIPLSKAPTWLEGLYATADRAGLMFSGSLTASIPAILEAEGWDANRKDMAYLSARFKLSRRIPELIAFALSEDYLELRFHAGLSLQPSKISG